MMRNGTGVMKDSLDCAEAYYVSLQILSISFFIIILDGSAVYGRLVFNVTHKTCPRKRGKKKIRYVFIQLRLLILALVTLYIMPSHLFNLQRHSRGAFRLSPPCSQQGRFIAY